MSTFVWKRTHTIIAALVAVALVGGGIALAFNNRGEQTQPPTPGSSSPAGPTPTPTPESSPTTSSEAPKPATTDPLTGEKPSDGPVWVVKIDNHPIARPQISVGQADITVVEEVEGNLTRLAAVFHTKMPTRVGPVRSGRNTDVELFPMFGKPGFLYSGANGKVKRKIAGASLVPVLRESPRDSSRPAPHNVVLNLDKISKQVKTGKVQSIGWTFAANDDRWAKAGSGGSPDVRVGNDTFGFQYKKSGYEVSINGGKNNDRLTGDPVKTDNIIVLKVKNRHDTDTTDPGSTVSETVGEGKVTIYRDGKKLTGTWKRDKVSGPMTFTDSKGKDIPLKPGKSWLLLQG